MPFYKEHYMDRQWELLLGFGLAVIGIWLLWSAFDNRGKKMPWPLSGLMPV